MFNVNVSTYKLTPAVLQRSTDLKDSSPNLIKSKAALERVAEQDQLKVQVSLLSTQRTAGAPLLLEKEQVH